MSDATLLDAHFRDEAEERSLDHDLQVWKYFAGMGGTDKNTMITTVSWLLAFSATAIGYIVTNTQMIAGHTTHDFSSISRLNLLVNGNVFTTNWLPRSISAAQN